MEKDATIETVLNKIKENYNKQSAAVDSTVAGLEAKLKEYKSATKHDLLAGYLERNGLQKLDRRAEAAALGLYEALSDLPEFKPVGAEVSAPVELALEEEVEEEVPTPSIIDVVEWPQLQALSQTKPLVIFGGYVLEDKLRWLQGAGLNIEWVGNDGGSRAEGTVQRLAGKVRGGSYLGVIALTGLIGHHESGMLLTSCRASGTAWAMVNKAGTGQLRRILNEFDKHFTA